MYAEPSRGPELWQGRAGMPLRPAPTPFASEPPASANGS
jgi:hypothetical protein